MINLAALAENIGFCVAPTTLMAANPQGPKSLLVVSKIVCIDSGNLLWCNGVVNCLEFSFATKFG
jgi:hypothetical protein